MRFNRTHAVEIYKYNTTKFKLYIYKGKEQQKSIIKIYRMCYLRNPSDA